MSILQVIALILFALFIINIDRIIDGIRAIAGLPKLSDLYKFPDETDEELANKWRDKW